jgi:hypothetical protein
VVNIRPMVRLRVQIVLLELINPNPPNLSVSNVLLATLLPSLALRHVNLVQKDSTLLPLLFVQRAVRATTPPQLLLVHVSSAPLEPSLSVRAHIVTIALLVNSL